MATYSKGSLRQRGEGHWQARFCRTDLNGTKTVTRSFEATSKRAAEFRMQEIRQDLIADESQSRSPTDLVAYTLEYVDDRERGGQIEASTATNYHSSIKHISRHLEGFQIGEVTPGNVMDMQAGLLREGLVPDTVAKDHRVLKQIMDYAVDAGHIARTPFVKAVKPPKRNKPQPNALDEESRVRLLGILSAAPTTKQSIAAKFGLLAGLRREEITGLKWADIDLAGRKEAIRRAVGVPEGKTYLKGTKTDAGERVVILEESFASALAELKRSLGSRATDEAFVLGSEDTYCTLGRITKDFTSLAKTMNLTGVTGKRITFHDLRDTFAMHLIASGVNVKTVSCLIGHANAAMTFDVYTSNTPAGMDDAAEALEKLAG